MSPSELDLWLQTFSEPRGLPSANYLISHTSHRKSKAHHQKIPKPRCAAVEKLSQEGARAQRLISGPSYRGRAPAVPWSGHRLMGNWGPSPEGFCRSILLSPLGLEGSNSALGTIRFSAGARHSLRVLYPVQWASALTNSPTKGTSTLDHQRM